jgi:hypothetical protein
MNALKIYTYVTSVIGATVTLTHGYLERSRRDPSMPAHLHAVGLVRDGFIGCFLGPVLVPSHFIVPNKYRQTCPLSHR